MWSLASTTCCGRCGPRKKSQSRTKASSQWAQSFNSLFHDWSLEKTSGENMRPYVFCSSGLRVLVPNSTQTFDCWYFIQSHSTQAMGAARQPSHESPGEETVSFATVWYQLGEGYSAATFQTNGKVGLLVTEHGVALATNLIYQTYLWNGLRTKRVKKTYCLLGKNAGSFKPVMETVSVRSSNASIVILWTYALEPITVKCVVDEAKREIMITTEMGFANNLFQPIGPFPMEEILEWGQRWSCSKGH